MHSSYDKGYETKQIAVHRSFILKQSNENSSGGYSLKATSWEHYIVQVSLPPGILLSYTVFTLCHLKRKE